MNPSGNSLIGHQAQVRNGWFWLNAAFYKANSQ